MSNERLMYGSIATGIISGVLLLILIGWIPLYGWIIAGFAAGLASRGSARGFMSALISGVVEECVICARINLHLEVKLVLHHILHQCWKSVVD